MKRTTALALVAMAVAWAGCVSPAATMCSDGRVCPPGSRCDVMAHRCVTSEEDTACRGHAEGAACTIMNAPGTCRGGACESHYCGDDVRTETEACDGTDLAGKSCKDLGFYGQTTGLGCTANCTFDTKGCVGACGDQKVNGTEKCDGSDLGGADCKTAGFYEAAGLTCSPFCTFDVAACKGFCGDKMINGPETCDGPALGGADCKTLGFYEGPGLACSPLCTFDVAACKGFCGDALTNGPEACDGATPVGQTCLDYGFDHGLLGCSARCAPAFDQCDSIGWKRIPSQAAYVLAGIWGSAANDIFAVGGFGSIVHWDGVAWSPLASGTSADLYGVWGSSTRDVYAVGTGGTIVHWDGATWSTMTSATTNSFHGVWGSGAHDIYAVGFKTLEHWDGTKWSELWSPELATTLGSADHRGVWGSSANDVYVVGWELIAHWDGETWSQVTNQGLYEAVWGSGPDDVFVVGWPGDSRHWNGTSWSRLPVPSGYPFIYRSVWGSGPNDVFVIADADNVNPGSPILHWNGVTWSRAASYSTSSFGIRTGILRGVGERLAGFWGSGPDNVFAVGEPNVILRTKGTSLTSEPVPLEAPMLGASSLGDVFAGGGSALMRWDGTTWSQAAMGSNASLPPGWVDWQAFGPEHYDVNLTHIWGSGPNDAYAVGDIDFYHWDGTTWNGTGPQITSPCGGGTAPAYDPNRALVTKGVWGSGPNDVFIVGTIGSILHWDGTCWGWMDSGTTLDLLDVWGSAANDVYAVGKAGTILHFDGTRWSMLRSGITKDLLGVRGSGPSDVFAAAADTLFHLRNGAWEPIALPALISAIWVTPTRVFLAGAQQILRLERDTVTCTGPEQFCGDGWDNDCDGLIDGDDPDCKGKVTEQCANLVDDDGDGLVDCADPDCASFPSCRNKP
jgi:hypothetical protein